MQKRRSHRRSHGSPKLNLWHYHAQASHRQYFACSTQTDTWVRSKTTRICVVHTITWIFNVKFYRSACRPQLAQPTHISHVFPNTESRTTVNFCNDSLHTRVTGKCSPKIPESVEIFISYDWKWSRSGQTRACNKNRKKTSDRDDCPTRLLLQNAIMSRSVFWLFGQF